MNHLTVTICTMIPWLSNLSSILGMCCFMSLWKTKLSSSIFLGSMKFFTAYTHKYSSYRLCRRGSSGSRKSTRRRGSAASAGPESSCPDSSPPAGRLSKWPSARCSAIFAGSSSPTPRGKSWEYRERFSRWRKRGR